MDAKMPGTVMKDAVRNERRPEGQGERREVNILPKNCKSCHARNNLSSGRRMRVDMIYGDRQEPAESSEFGLSIPCEKWQDRED
jgi:hypothetical protein